jgi:organic radical activating enzyme
MTISYTELKHGQTKYQNYFVVNWCFFSICNYSCSYCPTALHDGKKRGLPIEVVKSFCEKIIHTKKDKKLFFEFTGGEMTYYRSFIELFEFLKSNDVETGLISNGSRDLDFWKKHKHLMDHICLSFHPEQGDPEHFFEVTKLLNADITVHVNIMMLPAKFDDLYQLACRIAGEIEGISISMQALFEEMDGKIYNYTADQQAILNSQELPRGKNIKFFQNPDKVHRIYRGEMHKVYPDGKVEVTVAPELIARQENNWKGWECNIGLENIVINFNGEVMRGWCGVGGVIGNVSDPSFTLPQKPIVCTSMNCHCSLDVMATKRKIF